MCPHQRAHFAAAREELKRPARRPNADRPGFGALLSHLGPNIKPQPGDTVASATAPLILENPRLRPRRLGSHRDLTDAPFALQTLSGERRQNPIIDSASITAQRHA
jgi:hypothetical protein